LSEKAYDELRKHDREIMDSKYGTTSDRFRLIVSCIKLVKGSTTEQWLAFCVAIMDHDRSRRYRPAMYAVQGTERGAIVQACCSLTWRIEFFQELETTAG
jgi:hypothetical protein